MLSNKNLNKSFLISLTSLFVLLLFTSFTFANTFHRPPSNTTDFQFLENKGQWDKSIFYKSNIGHGDLIIERSTLVYYLKDFREIGHQTSNKKNYIEDPKIKSHIFKVSFKDANPYSTLSGEEATSGYYNFIQGNDSRYWASQVKGYRKVNFDELYKGIDLDYYSKKGFLKYDFVVQPHIDPKQIQMVYEGAESIKIENGQLLVKTSVVDIREKAPYAYQLINNRLCVVPCAFVLQGNTVSYHFPQGYNKDYPLTIDPELIFSTYSGSGLDNFGFTATFDNDGYLYSGSAVYLTDNDTTKSYPTTLGAFQTSYKGGFCDVAISKYDTTGTKMIYSTLLGGSNSEVPHSIIANSAGQLYILGTTGSLDFPLANPVQSVFNGGDTVYFAGVNVYHPLGADIFITKLNKDGTGLISSTYFGGSSNDGINSLDNSLPYRFQGIGIVNKFSPLCYNYADEMRGEIDIDAEGAVFISTCTASSDFPILGNGFQKTFGGGGLDGCVVKFDNSLSQVLWSTYIGGSGVDALYSIDFDSIGQVYVAGGTNSIDLPTSTTAIQRTSNRGRSEGYIAKLNATGTTILASTYWGTFSYDQIYFVELDGKGNIYVLGQAEDPGNFYIRNAGYSVPNSGQFISKFNGNLSQLVWSTSFGSAGGLPNISPTAFLVDLCSKVYLSGWGGGNNAELFAYNPNTLTAVRANRAVRTIGLPTTPDAFQRTTDGSDFYLMVLEDDASRLVYASFFGGNLSEEHVDGGTSRFDRKGKIYQSVCAGCGGNSDFPIKPFNAVSPINGSENCNNGVFKFDFNLPIVVSDFTFSGCNPIFFTNRSLTQKATRFLWRFGDGTSSSERNPTHTYKKSGTYKVTLIVSDNLTCNLADSLIREVYISPLFDGVSASATPETIVEGQSSTLTALPEGSYDYSWTPRGVLSNPEAQITQAKPKDTTDFEVEITDRISNCSYKARTRVSVIRVICEEPYIYVPNAFTPNDDNKNEVLKVRGEIISSMYFAIYNRWGEKVFDTKDPNKGWDGTYRGKKLDPDVYVYYLEGVCIDEDKFLFKGNITLLR